MPAAAVIPAPIAYIKVVAVKKLVVGFWACLRGLPRGVYCAGVPPFRGRRVPFGGRAAGAGTFTVKKLECLKQACA